VFHSEVLSALKPFEVSQLQPRSLRATVRMTVVLRT
jgi:hypothetical protein